MRSAENPIVFRPAFPKSTGFIKTCRFQPVDKPALGIGRKRVCRVNVEKIAEEVQKSKQMQ